MSNVLKRNNVKVVGEGPKTIIFAHGFGCDQHMWRHIVPSFEKDFRIILFDYVGSGNSDLTAYDSKKYGTLHGYVQDVLDVIEELQIEQAVFVGHSVSSMIGMLASISRPECFEHIIMVGPSPRYLNDTDGYFGGFEESDILELLDMMEMNFIGWASYMAPLVSDNLKPIVTKEVESSFNSMDPIVTKQFAEVTFFSDHREDLAKATVPTLILQCSDDSIVPIGVGEYLDTHLKNSEFRLMEVKGHYPHLSHPNETVQLIKDYLELA